MLTTIRIIKPSFVIGENVAGLVSMENGKTLDRILSDLENEGYTVESFIIPACAVGAWHRRDRIWILAHTLNNTNRTNRRQKGKEEKIQGKCREAGCGGMFSRTSEDVSNSNSQGLQAQWKPGGIPKEKRETRTIIKRGNLLGTGWDSKIWQSEPNVGRVAHGVSNRVDRLKSLGNAIVPQVAYELFKAIDETNHFNNR